MQSSRLIFELAVTTTWLLLLSSFNFFNARVSAFLSPPRTSSSSSLAINNRFIHLHISSGISFGHQDAVLPNQSLKQLPSSSRLHSTPFDLDLYSNNDDDDQPDTSEEADDNDDRPPLAASPSTKLILGINKYSHDTTLCAADAQTSEVLFAISKERISRTKHDGGNIVTLIETCLDTLDLNIDNIHKVIMNNHHHRILPIENDIDHMEWEEGLVINGGIEDGYSDEYNVLESVVNDNKKLELSHHLAHAYSVCAQSPFDTGLVVVMDGMGETYRAMKIALDSEDDSYVSDFTLCKDSDEKIELVPKDLDMLVSTKSYYDWREAESVYTFCKDERNGLKVKPIFKRFTQENSPPTLYNHGFENMDSLGALYSRASSHIFGDWNACGKVMGLAPWQDHAWDINDEKGEGKMKQRIIPQMIDAPIVEGTLYQDGCLKINRMTMKGMPFIARVDPDMFDDEGNMIRTKRYDFDDNNYQGPTNEESGGDKKGDNSNDGGESSPASEKQLPTKVALDAIGLAARMQTDLESVAMDFVRHFKEQTGETNLCLAGGVALNSVLNGRLSRELGFENTFIPPYPGDDGIAVGCCAYGLFGEKEKSGATPKLWNEPLSPYLGPLPTSSEMAEAVAWAQPWLDVEIVKDEKKRIDILVEEISSGGVVAIYNGRSEMGPRALGHRSILADPRKKGLVRFINEFVKKRESFRPFAPSCLAEEASEWFDLGDYAAAVDNNVSPYMSLTAQVKKSKRAQIPAVTHVDGSSRLQTVTPAAEPFYHKLISAFYKATGVPMVLNTSFNTLKSEPIVETPRNAIRSFLSSMGTVEILVMGDYVIKRKDVSIRRLLGEEQKNGLMTAPSFPIRAGAVDYQNTFTVDNDDISETKTLVRMPARPMHNDKDGWFELLDDLEGQLLGLCDGTNGVNEIMTQFAAMSGEEQQFDKITDFDQVLFENIVRRLVRLYEHTLISW